MEIQQLLDEFESKGKNSENTMRSPNGIFTNFSGTKNILTGDLFDLVQQGLAFDKTDYPWEKLTK